MVYGIGTTYSEEKTSITIAPLWDESRFTKSCVILDSLPIDLPPYNELSRLSEKVKNLKLADPTFEKGGSIDLILGSAVFWNSLLENRIASNFTHPTLQETIFGWVVGGSCNSNSDPFDYEHIQKMNQIHVKFVKEAEIHKNLENFWKLEDMRDFDEAETHVCETLFSETTYKSSDNHFVVQLPFKEDPSVLGNSKRLALKRFFLMEKKLQSNKKLKDMYIDFMREYESLGHMTEVPTEHENDEPSYYIPHLGVLRENRLTTRLRVVFDASAKTSTGKSLNDIIHVGPTIQSTLFSILIRFREYPVVVAADVTKMYRMVLIHPDHRNMQRIFWREDPSQRIKTYVLNTVTYGTSPAPFLAIRSLRETSNGFTESLPLGACHVKKSFYVDDFLGGGKDEKEAKAVKIETETVASSGGNFKLRKWTSNVPAILTDEPEHAEPLYINDSEEVKTLGIEWHPVPDKFWFSSVPNLSAKNSNTKRTILSESSKLFDPLGLVSPIVIRARLIVQKIWQEKLEWDQNVPTSISQEWSMLLEDIQNLKTCKIPRHLLTSPDNQIRIIHGFSDASPKAFGACIYVATFASNSSRTEGASRLICSKSRVAPLKPQSLPRLELCGTKLLSELMKKVIASLNYKPHKVFLWSDSSIALHWIANCASKWQLFVANRVQEIQNLTQEMNAKWNHVSSTDNPADLISRGTTAKQLINDSFWWEGPNFIKLNESMWPKPAVKIPEIIPEMKKVTVVVSVQITLPFPLFVKFSDLEKILRIVSYCLRFVYNIREKIKNNKSGAETTCNLRTGQLSSIELHEALKFCVKAVQNECFKEERHHLLHSKEKELFKSSTIRTLQPFIDKENIIRVGGRLQKSKLSYEQKHQMLLPKNHRFTELVFNLEHLRLLHASPKLLLSSIRQQFWPVHGPALAQKTVSKCITCKRANPKEYSQIMAPLPSERIIKTPPFTYVGLDYTGSISVRNSERQNAAIVKSYIGIFVCFTTKAVHLEMIKDLSTKSFLKALQRFVYRRGIPSRIFSDNAKTFVGAKNEMKKTFDNKLQDPDIINYLTKNRIEWKFSPPQSPHHNGLAEAAVRQFKQIFLKVTKNHIFEKEEISTLIIQIEGILNSRPLVPLSSSPEDFEALTPGHFLIGRALTAIPLQEALLRIVKHASQLAHYSDSKKMFANFWEKWRAEYLNELQVFRKWHSQKSDLKVGELVVVKEKFLPPLFWKLARVEKLHPGSDGRTRVVTLRTSQKTFVRAVSEICLLPVFENHSS